MIFHTIIKPQELIQMGWDIEDTNFKSISYLQFDTIAKTVNLYTTTTDKLKINKDDAINLTEKCGYKSDYYETLEDLNDIKKLPKGRLIRNLSWLELRLYSDIETLASDILLLEKTPKG